MEKLNERRQAKKPKTQELHHTIAIGAFYGNNVRLNNCKNEQGSLINHKIFYRELNVFSTFPSIDADISH